MSSITIRPATIDDAALIADLSRQTFYETFAPHNTKEDMEKFMSEQFSRERLISQVQWPGNLFYLAYADEEIAGYVRMLEGSNPPGLGKVAAIEIARIYAASNVIGKGIGSALMQHCLQVAKDRKKKFIWLGVWEKNQRAIDFYIKWGFERFGEHEFVLGNDVQTDWLMKRAIG